MFGKTYRGNSYYGAVFLAKGGSVTNLTGGAITSVSTLPGANYGVTMNWSVSLGPPAMAT